MIGLRSGMGASGPLQDPQNTQKRLPALSTVSRGGFPAMHTHLQRFTFIRDSGKMQAEWKLAETHAQCCLCRG